ncbi:MAG: Dihydroorotate dehydrogenase, catalytic subunit, partial [Actinobacteria bacterium]|nr:Dihydroorotate dehydrogenase, catalytic subunit [Actinomycetota bacterium]
MSGMRSGPAVRQETETVRQIDRNAEPPSPPEGRVRRGPVDLSVVLGGVTLRSPIVSASGCFGSGREISEFFDLRQLGAVTVKSMTLEPWQGKPTPRMVETPSGMLNAIGLQNKGVEYFLQYDLRWLNSAKVPVIASIAGNTKDEFVRVADRLRGAPGVIAIEANISCPNLEDRDSMFSHDAKATAGIITAIRRQVEVPLFAKLSPNVTSITEIAGAAIDSGAQGLSLINTVVGMAIDIETGKPALGGVMGGLSGPAIRPIAVRAVYEVHQAFPDTPIIGMGGVTNAHDAIEMLMAGATA